MAPEMIKNDAHNTSLDIWCLGVLLYELTHGYPPFSGQNDSDKLKNILNTNEIKFDKDCSKDLKNLIVNIL